MARRATTSAPKGAEPASGAVGSALKTVLTERNGLDVLGHALSGTLGAAFEAAVAIIGAATGRIIVTGMGKSGHVGRKIAATMASTGTPAHFVHPAEASHGDLGMIQRDDVILAMSWSGETAELSDIVAYATRFRVALVAVTANPDSTLAKAADVCLALPRAQEACPNGLAPTTSTTMQMVLGDALAVALLEAKGFSPSDFLVFHPGGKLGAQLKQVSTIMHGGDELPLVSPSTRLTQALPVMSAKGFGCVIVAEDGVLAGIVTDGDLRRHMSASLADAPVSSIMTRQPRTITPDTLIAEALEIIETRRITSLIVVEGQRAVGLVHVMDLLRTGAA
jgi:arabinose-5-phosphate isomerase